MPSLELSKPKQSVGPVVVEVAMRSVRGEMWVVAREKSTRR